MSLHEWAVIYASEGYRVFPCGGKIPLTPNGCKDATTDINQIDEWWTKHPLANIGIATGNGLAVLDVDYGKVSEEDFFRYKELITWTVATPNGGYHKYFRGNIRNSVSKIAPGVDTRGEGGYVIAPPSSLEGVGHYDCTYSDEDAYTSLGNLPTFPQELAELLDKKEAPREARQGAGLVPVGGRNDYLARVAGALQRRGLSYEALEAALLAENENKLEEPLSDAEVRRIAKSVSRYTPESPIEYNSNSGEPQSRGLFELFKQGTIEGHVGGGDANGHESIRPNIPTPGQHETTRVYGDDESSIVRREPSPHTHHEPPTHHSNASIAGDGDTAKPGGGMDRGRGNGEPRSGAGSGDELRREHDNPKQLAGVLLNSTTSNILIPARNLGGESLRYLRDKDAVRGQPTLIEGLDKLLGGGKRLGEVTCWHAEAKTGKNTLWHYLMYLALELDIPQAYASRELGPAEEVLPNLFSVAFRENSWLKDIDETTEAKYQSKLNEWPLYFSKGYGYFPPQEIKEWLEAGVAAGIQYYWFDHLHYMIEDPEDHKAASRLIKDIKALAKTLNIHVDIIIQPNKLSDGQKLSLNSIKGGAAMGQAIDNLLILERVKGAYDPTGNSTVTNVSRLTLDVARSKLARPGSLYLQFDPETCSFGETEPLSAPQPLEETSPSPADQAGRSLASIGAFKPFPSRP